MRIAIVYSSSEGQTEKIVERLGREAESAGHEVHVCRAAEAEALAGYDFVFVAGSIHYSRFQKALSRFIVRCRDLNETPWALVAVSLSAVGQDEQSAKTRDAFASDFLRRSATQPVDVVHVAGALRYSQYGWFKRFLMRRIAANKGLSVDSSCDHEYTDWEQVAGLLRVARDYESV